jgi:hypothetical protein
MSFKIINGTPKSGKSLCLTCKHGKVVKGQECQEVLFCSSVFSKNYSYGYVPFRISECAEYHPSNMPWLHEMENMAWKIEARKRGPVGFEPDRCEMEIVITKPTSSNLPED